MKVTIEFEADCEWQSCGANLLHLVGNCLRGIPGRPTVVVKVPAKANGVFCDGDGKVVLSDMVLTVTPKTKM